MSISDSDKLHALSRIIAGLAASGHYTDLDVDDETNKKYPEFLGSKTDEGYWKSYLLSDAERLLDKAVEVIVNNCDPIKHPPEAFLRLPPSTKPAKTVILAHLKK